MHKMVNGVQIDLTPEEIEQLNADRAAAQLIAQQEQVWREWKAAKVTPEEFMIEVCGMFTNNQALNDLLSQTESKYFKSILQHLENEPKRPE